MNIEIKRNEWVAKQLTLESIYRDDNCFIELTPNIFEEGAIAGQIVLAEDGTEYLVDHNGENEVEVPTELRLYVYGFR